MIEPRVRWQVAYLEYRYGKICGMVNLLRLARDTDFHSGAAWVHWFLWVFGLVKRGPSA